MFWSEWYLNLEVFMDNSKSLLTLVSILNYFLILDSCHKNFNIFCLQMADFQGM